MKTKEELKAYNRKWEHENREHRKVQQRVCSRKRNQHFKEVVVSHYGNGIARCVFCGETRLPTLSIDHINGGGTKERRELKRTGSRFYEWLIETEFPEGYRTLCMNCQFVEKDKMHKFKETLTK